MADENPVEAESPISVDVGANRLTLLADGPARLDALIHLIDNAKTDLRVLYYIFLDDDSGIRVREALIEAANRGVTVSMLVDGFGSASNRDLLAPLLESRIAFCRFSP